MYTRFENIVLLGIDDKNYLCYNFVNHYKFIRMNASLRRRGIVCGDNLGNLKRF